MMTGIGLALPRFQRASGGSAALTIPVHSRFVALGDSITAQKSNCKGTQNWVFWTCFNLGGRLRPGVAADQGIGGNTMNQMLARIAYTTAQKPDVVFFMGGRNDIAAADSLATLQSDALAITSAIHAANPNCIIVWAPLLPATSDAGAVITKVSDFNTWRLTQEKTTGTNRILVADVPAGWTPATHTSDGTHANILGARLIADTVVTKIGSYVEAGDVTTQVTASGFYGSNLDTEYSLPGTAGSKTGTVTPINSVATGKEVTNNLTNGTAVQVDCQKGTIGGDATQVMKITGTPAAEATVVFDEASGSNVTISGVQGDFFEYLVNFSVASDVDGVSAPTGFRNLQAQLGSIGINGNAAADASNTTELAAAVLGVLRTWPIGVRAVSASISPDVTMRFAAAATTARVTLSRPIVRKTELVAYAAPTYMGSDGIKAATETLRITGTAGVGNVLTGEPGTWSGGAITHSPQWYRNGSAIGGATAWTYTQQAGDSGTTITFRTNPSNSFGSDTTTTSSGVAVP